MGGPRGDHVEQHTVTSEEATGSGPDRFGHIIHCSCGEDTP